MLGTLQTVLIALLTLGILVTIHEFGHFWVARRCGIRVLRFSVGFGPVLWRKTDRQQTEYTLCAIPLGGYVRMLDEREGAVAEEQLGEAFNRKSVWARIAVVSAGPIANFLLAILVFWFLFFRGETGLVPVIAAVAPDTPAHYAGLEVGQEIISVDGHPTPTVAALGFKLLDRLGDSGLVQIGIKYPDSDMVYFSEAPLNRWLIDQEQPDPIAGLGITIDTPKVLPIVESTVGAGPASIAGFVAGDLILRAGDTAMPLWSDWVTYVRARPGEMIDVLIRRAGVERPLTVTPESRQEGDQTIGAVGMMVRVPEFPTERIRVFERGPLDALGAAVMRTGSLIGFTFDSMAKMVQGLISPKNLSGPITIAQVAASSAASGVNSWLSFLALLSISLGALNLLPIPVLDGGHLLYYVIEALTGRAVPEKVQMFGYQIGIMLVLSIMSFALYNDFLRL
tara:strand:- start:729 stop:2084 length:1356 start_codon:yes stop_codon:yes gene_type:complete